MFETDEICPYTGLRSFTEEESLYFKGRDQDIDQASEQLQRNKFLILTGASGDGKSSLIYAGIIPNARAGFLKSKYTQWCVADFRPERAPFRNLCRSVARELGIASVETVESELNHGFSALVDLYKNSKRYTNTLSPDWESATETERTAMKREAANLIILVDQFEEFFTNPENYHKGVPSADANLVLNLLLETARISLEEDLPVYVVFTMRSDFIGQCAAFRGLPEYIGFSQFFVPRLNRTQLQLVIEEPATLSGNRISRRLTERLILDLTEGVDQLPILQHALNQIWHAASNGKEEMDLIHYAMVGGMPAHELPDEQVDRFNQWFEQLPAHIKACYHKPDLQNVLDTHTNKLYEQAADYYSEKTGRPIPDADAKLIVRTAFSCLTKIDQSRAVRNRMTLREITNILGRNEYGTAQVAAVLNIFREPGNTFIRPFMTEDPTSQTLDENDVLDITHESLIRNWEYLGQWAAEEFENYVISLDFEQQLNRWVESGKSTGFLLPIGPLTYFESWFNKVKPNAEWIARYLPEDIEKERKLQQARQVLYNAKQFLAKSAARLIVTRTIMHYGAKRIALVLGMVAILVLSSFAVSSYLRKQNDYVLNKIDETSLEIANKNRLSPEFVVPALNERLMLGRTTIPEIIDAIASPRQKIKIATAIATQLVTQGRYEPQQEIFLALSTADSLLETLPLATTNRELSEVLKLLYDYSVVAEFAHYFNPTDSLRTFLTRNATRSVRWYMHVLEKQPEGFDDVQFLNMALEHGINYRVFTAEQISRVLGILSPFENENRTNWVENNYHRDRILERGNHNYGHRFNALFQDLAYLYAATGRPSMALRCVDSILRYQDNFYQNDYATFVETAAHIAAVFHIYATTEFLDDFVQGYCSRKSITPVDFYSRMVAKALSRPFQMSNTNFYAGGGGQTFSNQILSVASDEMMAFFYSKLREQITRIADADQRNFAMACALKNEGLLISFRNELRKNPGPGADHLFSEAISLYRRVPDALLNQSMPVVGAAGTEIINMPARFLFLYPDFRVPFHPFEPRSNLVFYYSPAFSKFVLDRNLFDSLYRSEDLQYFEVWTFDYHAAITIPALFVREPMPPAFMERLAAQLEARKGNQVADMNILYLHLIRAALHSNELEKGIAFLERIQPDKLLNAFQYNTFLAPNNYSFELVANAIATCAVADRFDIAFRLVDVFNKPVNRSSLYAAASQDLSLSNRASEAARRLLDSARAEMGRLDNPSVFQPNRHQIAMALMYLDPEDNSSEAYRVIKNSPNKFQAIFRFARAHARRGNLYEAQQQAPALISTEDRAGFIRHTLAGYLSAQPENPEWKRFIVNQPFFTRRFIPYINESQ